MRQVSYKRRETEGPIVRGAIRLSHGHRTQGGGSGRSLPPPATCPLEAQPLLLWARALSPPPCQPLPRFLLSVALHLGCPGPAKHRPGHSLLSRQPRWIDGDSEGFLPRAHLPGRATWPQLPLSPLAGSAACWDSMMGVGAGPHLILLWLRCDTCSPLRRRRPRGMACSWL